MIEVIHAQGDESLARVFVGRLPDGTLVEFAESVQPPVPRERKWVIILSTLRGCPFRCPICDAGRDYRGRLSAPEILAQADCAVRSRFPDGRPPVRTLKVQLARMGDPALNDAVIEVLRELPERYPGPEIVASLSTVAPAGRERFFENLARIKRDLYAGGRFQLQISMHTTDEDARRRLVPARTWSFAEMGAFGRRFVEPGDRKVTLNFAPVAGFPLRPAALLEHFDPATFLVKLTPVNPTRAAIASGFEGLVDPARPETGAAITDEFRSAGYETILSIGETAENAIGSNCGMFVTPFVARGAAKRAGDARIEA